MSDPSICIGLIVNPVAGLGGSVGLRGTDGRDIVQRARSLGATPVAGERATRALRVLRAAGSPVRLLTCVGEMGEAQAGAAGLAVSLALPVGNPTTDADTRRAAASFAAAAADLILFAGGDGTARDILDAVGSAVPILGIPAGVKMYSAVFAVGPEAAGRLAATIAGAHGRIGYADREVLDLVVNPEQTGRSAIRLHGYARAPFERRLLQSAKAGGGSEDAELDGACREIAAEMQPGVGYLIGPGTTTRRVLDHLDIVGSLLGVDAIRDGKLAGADLRADQLDAFARSGPIRIVLGVVGGQGFVLGRGNQPISPSVMRAAGREGLIIVAAQAKLLALQPARLLVDTGDPALDRELAGYVRVRTAPGRTAMMRLGPD